MSNKWATVHILHEVGEEMNADTSIAKFKADGDAHAYAVDLNERPYVMFVAVQYTYGDVYNLPKPCGCGRCTECIGETEYNN